MSVWERPIRSYVSPGGRDKIRQWYDGLSVQERAYADGFIKNQRRVREWKEPQYKVLSNGVGELRWFSEGKQQRLLGFFQADVWIALIGCKHKQRVYTPPDCLETAQKRKKKVERQEVQTVELDL